MNAGKKIVFRCDAGRSVGMGHLARCRALATWCDAEDVIFVVAADDAAARSLGGARHLPLGISARQEADWWLAEHVSADAIVFDLSYPARMADRAATRELVTLLCQQSVPVRILIDGIGSQIMVKEEGWPLDAIIIPTAGGRVAVRDVETAMGASYFILPREWGAAPVRDPSRPVRRILVTIGGSDPYGLTIRVLEALADAPGDWTLAVVIGPAFAPALADAIRALAARNERIAIVDTPATLRDELVVADLAVTATGLTKYEAAWAGTPSVQISIDRLHAELNASFAAEETAFHLGDAGAVTADAIRSAVSRLTANADQRVAMSRRGQALVDGLGGARIVKKIRMKFDA